MEEDSLLTLEQLLWLREQIEHMLDRLILYGGNLYIYVEYDDGEVVSEDVLCDYLGRMCGENLSYVCKNLNLNPCKLYLQAYLEGLLDLLENMINCLSIK
jgi:hypothetical protein